MDYTSDPIYNKKEAIRNLDLVFKDGFWWREGLKCIPKANQESILEEFWRNGYEKGTKEVTEDIRKHYYWPNLARDVKDYAKTHTIVGSKRERSVIQRVVPVALSKALNWIARYCAVKIDKLSKRNIKRLNMMLSITNGYQLEATLVDKLIRIYPAYNIIALEYTIDDGGLNRQQHGDVLFMKDDDIIVVECKNIYGFHKRQKEVKEQALRCAERIESWIEHLSKFDDTFKKLSNMNIRPAIFTEVSKELEFL